mgnify:CR=1 FL=1
MAENIFTKIHSVGNSEIMVSYKLSYVMMRELLILQEEFDLSYSQMTRYLYRRFGVKITPSGLRKALVRDLPNIHIDNGEIIDDNSPK